MTTFLLWVALGGLVGAAIGAAVDWRHRRPKGIIFTIVADGTAFSRAMADVARSVEKMQIQLGRQLVPTMRAIVEAASRIMKTNPKVQLLLAQERHGAGNRTGAGSWRSDMCSAWVHGSCPGYHCDCGCHK